MGKKIKKNGIEGLEVSKAPLNRLVRYQRRKELSYEEELEFKILKLEIENERLKKVIQTRRRIRSKLYYKFRI